MAQKIVKTKLVHRRGLSTKWSSVNPILLDGEMGIEKDTRKFKIGDGVTSWNNLPYANVTYDVFNSKFSVRNDENTPGTAPVRDDINQIHVNTTSQSDSTVAVNKGYMERHVEAEINKISQGGKVATLDESGKIPASQLPSYVDDVVEGFKQAGYNNAFLVPNYELVEIPADVIEKIYFNDLKKQYIQNYVSKTIESVVGLYNYKDIIYFAGGNKLTFINTFHDRQIAIRDSNDNIIEIIFDNDGSKDLPYSYTLSGVMSKILYTEYPTNENHKKLVMDLFRHIPFDYTQPERKDGVIFVDLSTNKTYRWSGTYYTEISPSLALGETSSTAYAGNKGKQNADNIAALQTKVEGLQPKEDSTLKTTSKTVPGAINELKQKQDTNSTNIQTNTTNITKLQQDLSAAATAITSNYNRINDLEGVADEVLIEIEELKSSGGSGGGDIIDANTVLNGNFLSNKIYTKSKANGGWKGVTIPNTGRLNRYYINVKLTNEEVENLINTIDFSNVTERNGFPTYLVMYFNTSMTGVDAVIHKDGDALAISTYSSGNLWWCNEQWAIKQNISKAGWQDRSGWLQGEDNDYCSPEYDLYDKIYPDRYDETIVFPVGNQNDKLTSLFSLEPFEYVKPDVNFYQYQDGSLKKILNEDDSVGAITVSELPPIQIKADGENWLEGTEIPSSGQVDTVYFNTDLSIEEVKNILSGIDFRDLVSDGQMLAAIATTMDMSKGVLIREMEMNDSIEYVIACIDGEDYKTIFSTFTLSSYGLEEGWHYSEFDFNDITYLAALASQINAPIQNEKLTKLMSLSPFEKEKVDVPNPDIELDKLYRTPVKGDGKWVGTVVPNSGTVDKVYLNTELSVEEVKSLLEQLSYPVDAADNTYMYFALGASNKGSIICAKRNGMYTIQDFQMQGDSTIYWISEDYETYSAGWQTFDNPFVFETEVTTEEMGIIFGSQNDKLTSLMSTTSFVYSEGELTGYDYYQFKNGAPKKILNEDDAVLVKQVEELPPATIDTSTAVPSSGQVGKVYFNTKLSVEEVKAILDSLEYVKGVLSLPAVAVATTTDMSIGVVVMGSGQDSNYNIITGVVDGEEKHIFSYVNGAIDNGWRLSELELNIDNMLDAVASQVGMTIQNDKLKQLVSITPFEAPNTDIKLDKLYRTPIKSGGGEWVGTVVPNSGIVDKVYLNTNLSNEEIEYILSTITSYSEGAYSPLYTDSTGIMIMNQDGGMCILNTTTYQVYWGNELFVNAMGSDLGVTTAGWQELTNPIEINSEVLSSAPAIDLDSVGTENDKLSNLFSIKPFTQIGGETVGYKYHQFVNGEWKELGSGGDSGISKEEVNTLISEYMSANYDNLDEEEF